jgi:hypothetical protein
MLAMKKVELDIMMGTASHTQTWCRGWWRRE